MMGEAKPIINSLQLNFWKKDLPILLYSNELRNIVLAVNGIDKKNEVDLVASQPATMTATILCRNYQPDLIINAGSAGAFESSELKLGEVILGKNPYFFHDRRIPLEKYDRYGEGRIQGVDTKMLSKLLRLKQEIISTGNSLDHTNLDLKIIKNFRANVKDMEAAAIAWVCSIYKTQFFAVKSITDFIGKNNEEKFIQNFALSNKNLAREMSRIIELLRNKNYYNQCI